MSATYGWQEPSAAPSEGPLDPMTLPLQSGRRISTVLWQVVPGMVLPGLIYLVVSHHTSVIVALAVASCVPLLDAMVRLAQGRAPNAMSAVFLVGAVVSVGLALLSGSRML